MKSFEGHSGFTVNRSKLQVVEIIYKDDQFLLENVDEAYFDEQLKFESEKETKIRALLQGAFNELLVNHSLKNPNVSFTLPFDLFYIAQIPYDNTLLHQDLIDQFRWELSVLYPHTNSSELVLQYIEIEKNDYLKFNTAIVIAIPRKYLQILHDFCSANKINLNFIDNPHLASERALAVNHNYAQKGLVLSVYFIDKFLSVIFLNNGRPIYFNVTPLNDAGEIIEKLEDEIINNKILSIKKEEILRGFISGDDINKRIIKLLKENLNIEFKQFNPFEKIKPSANIYKNKFFIEKNNAFSPSAGIAYRIA